MTAVGKIRSFIRTWSGQPGGVAGLDPTTGKVPPANLPVFQPATQTEDGGTGVVPQPLAGDHLLPLWGNSTWGGNIRIGPFDALELADELAAALDAAVAASDAIAAADQVAAALEFERAVSDAAAVADDLGVSANLILEESDAVAVADQVLRAHDANRSDSDAVAVSDQVSSGFDLGRSASDAIAVADQVARELEAERSTTDSVAIVDALLEEDTTVRTVSDAIATADQVARELEAERVISDSVAAVVDVLIEEDTYVRTMSDSIAVVDALLEEDTTIRTVSDAIAVVDQVATVLEAARNLSDSVAVADQVIREHDSARTLSDSVAVADALLEEDTTIRTVSDAIAVVDQVAAGFEREATASDSIAAADATLGSMLSVSFDGVDEYADGGNVAALNMPTTAARSFFSWIKTSDAISAMVVGSKQTSAASRKGWDLRLVGGRLRWFNGSSIGVNGMHIRSLEDIFADGTWHLIGVTYDGSETAQGATLYLDGVPVASETIQDNSTNPSEVADSFNLATRDDGAGYFFDGRIDETSFWSKELSADEVREVWNGGTPGDLLSVTFSANLTGWWRMGEGDTHPTLSDNSGNGYDLSLVNTVAGNISSDFPGGAPGRGRVDDAAAIDSALRCLFGPGLVDMTICPDSVSPADSVATEVS